jgi:hypothetical protein
MDRIKINNFIIILLISATFGAFSFYPSYLLFGNACFNVWDFGIYLDALGKITINNLNPYLSIYGYRIFNDHFDPILIPFAIALPKTNIEIWALLIENVSIVSSIFILWKYIKSRLIQSYDIPILVWLICSPGIWYAATFPIHPSTWAIFPISLVLIFFLKDQRRFLILSLILLFTYREEYPFIGIGISCYYFLNKKFRFSLILLSLSLTWLWFANWGRKNIFDGEFSEYTGRVGQALSSPLEHLFTVYDENTITRMILILLPSILILVQFKFKLSHIFKIKSLYVLFPPLALRLFMGSWGYQYSIILIPIFIILYLEMHVLEDKASRLNLNFLIFSALISVLSAAFILSEKNLTTLTNPREVMQLCSLSNIEEKQVGNIISTLKKAKNLKILALPSIATYFSRFHPNMQTLTKKTANNWKTFDLILVETNSNESYPLLYSEMNLFRVNVLRKAEIVSRYHTFYILRP